MSMEKRFWSSRIRSLVPYVPGEQPRGQAFIKLNTNENPYPPSPAVFEAIRSAADETLRRYPDPEAVSLREALAEHYGLRREQVFCGNGSDEVLGLSFYALFSPGRKLRFPDITYSFYPVYARLFGLDYEEVPLEEDFSLPLEDFLGNAGSVVLCNPNAPTGRAIPREAVERVLRAHPEDVVLVDEAYADFGAESAVPLIDRYPNLLVVRTFSKSHALAGLRVGYALGQEELIAAVNCVKNSFNSYPLDRIALAAGEAAIRDTAYFEHTRQRVMATREKTALALEEMGFRVLPSRTNFLFITHPNYAGGELQQALRERGVLVRRFDRERISDFLRVSIGTEEEMERFCQLLRDFLSGERSERHAL